MQFIRHAVVAATAIVGLQGAASAATYTALTGTGFTTETTTLPGQYLTPLAPAGDTVASYSVLSIASGFASVGTITFAAPRTSYTFLWGSPDSFNSVTDGLVTVTGSSFSSGTGNNAQSTVYTFADAAGFTTLTFRTTGVAFELAAVSPVPEPSNLALLLGGVGAVLLIARRRKA